jgi:phosphoglycolate phosphatase-like HAD superfamily hydrolase
MIHQGRDDFALDLAHCWVVGDRWRDIDAGGTAGCRTVYLRHGYQESAARGYDYQVEGLDQLLE